MSVQLIRKVRDRQPTNLVFPSGLPIKPSISFGVFGGKENESSIAVAGNFVTTKDGVGFRGRIREYAANSRTQPTEGITVIALVTLETNSGVNERIVQAHDADTPPNYVGYVLFRGSNGRITFGVGDSTLAISLQTEISAELGFHCYIGVYDRKLVTLWKDGVWQGAHSRTTPISYNTESSPIVNGWYKSGVLRTDQALRGISHHIFVIPGILPTGLCANLSANPWQIFEPEVIPLFWPGVTAQFARPTSDASAGTWTASTGSDLYAMIDETAASDADYITTVNASTCEVALSTLSDPASSSGHIVRYRLSAEAGGVTVRLRQGTTTIASWTHSPAPASLTTYEQTLTGGEADAISDYAALKIQFEAI